MTNEPVSSMGSKLSSILAHLARTNGSVTIKARDCGSHICYRVESGELRCDADVDHKQASLCRQDLHGWELDLIVRGLHQASQPVQEPLP